MLNAVISGVGRTKFSRASGTSTLNLGAEAALSAVADAGLEIGDLDGIATFQENDSVAPDSLAAALGVERIFWSLNLLQGGSAMASLVGEAGWAVTNGRASHVLVYRAMNGASGSRMGDPGPEGAIDQSFALTSPYGYGSPLHWYAMACRRHMYEYGTTSEVLGRIAVQHRKYATQNPGAMMRRHPMTIDDYLASPWIAEPFRLLDCCQETDGAVAVVVSRPGATTPARQVKIASCAAVSGGTSDPPYERYPDMTLMFPHWIRDQLFRDAGLTPADIDIASLYDAFTFSVLCQLEDFGFFPKGEAADFVLDGYGRERPFINPNGGLLSEGYVHGLNNLAEAVVQLRGEAGLRQVSPARTALVSGFGYARGSAVVLVGPR